MSVLLKAMNRLSSEHERTIRAKKNILLAVFYRAIGVFIGFAVSPLSLAYLDQTRLGIFILISSTIDWFADFDMGIGNSLKNKLGEAVATGNTLEAKTYVSTAYGSLSVIFGAIAFVFIFVSFLIPWADLTETDPSMNAEIRMLAILVIGAFALRFVSSLIYEVFNALQQTAKTDLYNTLTKFVFLIVICVLIYFTESSLILFGAAKSFTFALVPLFVGLLAFRKGLKKYAPSLKLINKKYLKALLSLGGIFLLIKLSMIIIYQTNTFLINTYLGIEFVPIYDFPYKYFSILLMLFVIITNQLWPAFIEANASGDLKWMKGTIRNVVRIWMLSVVIGMIMLAFSDRFYYYWINIWQEEEKVLEFPFSVSLFICISVSLTNWVNAFNLVLNGTSKIRLQMFTMVFAAMVNIPLSILFADTLGMGLIGIILGTIVSLIPNAILAPIQVRKIIQGRDAGLWGK